MAIRTESLKAGYGNDIIIDEITIKIPRGAICSIIGPNGCGKSTLLKTISRNLPVLGGQVRIDGTEINRIDTRLLARKMAFLAQSPFIPEQFSVRELVSYGRFPHTRWMASLNRQDNRIIDWAMEIASIKQFEHRELFHLSGGEQQRVWIAMALAQEAEILLLDEPTTHLDISHQLQTLELIRTLNRDMRRTILMVLHDLNQAARFTDYILVLDKGCIIAEGKPGDIITEHLLRDVFRVEAKVVTDEETKRPYFIPIRSK